jgi:hypothetical protein
MGLAAALWCVASPATAQERAADPPPLVVVTLEGTDTLVGGGAAPAQRLVSGLYRDAGVRLAWRAEEGAVADRTLTVTITTSSALPAELGAEAMGVAPSPGDGTRGTHAYVFGDRVQAFADRYRVPVAYVLACAIAHEVGHLLLPPNAHAAGGIMRGSWHPQLFPPKAPGIERFVPEQARLLRLRSRREVATDAR